MIEILLEILEMIAFIVCPGADKFPQQIGRYSSVNFQEKRA